MKNRMILGLVMCTILSVSSIGVVSASEASIELPKHGEVNVDSMINEKVGTVQKSMLKSSGERSKTSAGGGTFWVEWGGDRHTSCYDHSTKTHKSTAENGNGDRISSGWVDAGLTARATIKSTVSGNKAYWDVY